MTVYPPPSKSPLALLTRVFHALFKISNCYINFLLFCTYIMSQGKGGRHESQIFKRSTQKNS